MSSRLKNKHTLLLSQSFLPPSQGQMGIAWIFLAYFTYLITPLEVLPDLMKCGIELCPQTLFTEKSACGRGLCVCWGWGPILFWKQLGLQVKRPVLFILSNKANCFSTPPGAFGRAGAGKKSLRPSKRAASGESQAFPDSFPWALLSCSESKKIIKALIYLYIFSIDIIDPTIAAF